jgi:hypothetical protein
MSSSPNIITIIIIPGGRNNNVDKQGKIIPLLI